MIQSILDQEFSGPDCKVYLFGSRARKTASPASDVDLAIPSSRDMHARIACAHLAFEESDLPFTKEGAHLHHPENPNRDGLP